MQRGRRMSVADEIATPQEKKSYTRDKKYKLNFASFAVVVVENEEEQKKNNEKKRYKTTIIKFKYLFDVCE